MQPAEINEKPLPRAQETAEWKTRRENVPGMQLDPGVNGLRLSVPHGVHQPDCGPAGPRRNLPAGVGLQQTSAQWAGGH